MLPTTGQIAASPPDSNSPPLSPCVSFRISLHGTRRMVSCRDHRTPLSPGPKPRVLCKRSSREGCTARPPHELLPFFSGKTMATACGREQKPPIKRGAGAGQERTGRWRRSAGEEELPSRAWSLRGAAVKIPKRGGLQAPCLLPISNRDSRDHLVTQLCCSDHLTFDACPVG